MAKVDKEYTKTVYSRLIRAKQALYEANQALQHTPEYNTVKKAEHDLELAQDWMDGLLTIMSNKVA